MFILIGSVILVIIIILAESIFKALWVGWYFKHGLEVFNRTFILSRNIAYPFNLEHIQSIVSRREYPDILFEKIETNRYAFRAPLAATSWNWFSPLLMRGLLAVDPSQRKVTIVGFINFYPIAMFLLFFLTSIIVLSSDKGNTRFFVILVPILAGILYYYKLNMEVQGLDKVFSKLSENSIN
jgi:hypothetical protein